MIDLPRNPRFATYVTISSMEAKLPCGHRSRWRVHLVSYAMDDERQLNQCSECGATWWLVERPADRE